MTTTTATDSAQNLAGTVSDKTFARIVELLGFVPQTSAQFLLGVAKLGLREVWQGRKRKGER